jgi:hypothetical protein
MRIAKPIIIMAVAVLPCLALAGQGPRITFDKYSHDYGKVLYGETVTEEFSLTNTGDETLIIEKLRSTCGCTKAVHGSQEIPPMGRSKIVAAFDTTGLRQGKKSQSVFVHSNDPNNPVVKLTIEAEVIREIIVEPPTVARQLVTFVDSVSFPMQITNSSGKDCAVTGIKEQPEGVQVYLNPARIIVGPGQKVPFTLVLKPAKEPDRHLYLGTLLLTMDHAKEKEAEIRYLLKIDKTQ